MTRQPAKQKFGEGDWFGVPLSSGGYAVGLIARRGKKYRSVLFGYFFGPKHDEIPTLADLAGLRPEAAIWRASFGHLGLRDGVWPVIGRDPAWERAHWPMPDFYRRDSILGLYTRVSYLADDPSVTLRTWRVAEEEVAGLPKDGGAGAGFVEQRLSKLIEQNGIT
jgi:hypothetical protein